MMISPIHFTEHLFFALWPNDQCH